MSAPTTADFKQPTCLTTRWQTVPWNFNKWLHKQVLASCSSSQAGWRKIGECQPGPGHETLNLETGHTRQL